MTTALGIITSAMRKAGILTKGESASADEAADGMIILKKGDAVKILSDNSSLIDGLKFEGWVVEGEKVQVIAEAVEAVKPVKKKKEDK
jgi:hypothetical protein